MDGFENIFGFAPHLRSRTSGVYAFRNRSESDAKSMAGVLAEKLGEPYVQTNSHVPGLHREYEFDERSCWATLDWWTRVDGMRMLGYISDDPDFLGGVTGWGNPAEGRYHVTLHIRPNPTKIAKSETQMA